MPGDGSVATAAEWLSWLGADRAASEIVVWREVERRMEAAGKKRAAREASRRVSIAMATHDTSARKAGKNYRVASVSAAPSSVAHAVSLVENLG